MENVVLIVHLILALCLIGAVLLQRSEGGGMGLGGGGGAAGGGIVSTRGAATALGKVTWIFAIGFIITSITLTILAAQSTSGSSVLDSLGIAPSSNSGSGDLPTGESLLPPAPVSDADTVPRAD